MNSSEEVLTFLDLLDLDEDVIDARLQSIMARSNYNNKHLTNALQLLHYKYLINTKENCQCNNVKEYDFVAKLIKEIHEDIVLNVCKITNIVLKLNIDTLHFSSEHLLLQIMHNIDSSCDQFVNNYTTEKEKSTTLLYLKVCDSILDALIEKEEKLTVVFMHVPVKKLLNSSDIQAKVHFLNSSVPKMFSGIDKYDILTEIWNYLEDKHNDDKIEALKIISSLSDFYLPSVKPKNNTEMESNLIYYYRFWDILLCGLQSDDQLHRKIALYLAKRAIDYITNLPRNVCVESNDHKIFSWDCRQSNVYKTQWDNFFILMESLEEKQSNIVLPSLQLFEKLSLIGHCWLIPAYNIGLKHDNNQVRLKCAENRMKTNINSNSEAVALIKAQDDIHFFENSHECVKLKSKIVDFLKNNLNLKHILKAIPDSNLSAVPFYHLSKILASLDNTISCQNEVITDIVIDILKSSCNIIAMRKAIHMNIATFVGKSCKNLHWKNITKIISNLQLEMKTLEQTKNPIINLLSNLDLDDVEKEEFYNMTTVSHTNIDIGLIYYRHHLTEFNKYAGIVKEKVQFVQSVTNRHYANKAECFKDVIYILTFLDKCTEEDEKTVGAILEIRRDKNVIIQYLYSLLSSDLCLTIDENKELFDNNFWKREEFNNTLIEIYKTAVLLLRDPRTDLDKIILSIFIVNTLTIDLFLEENYKHEMLDLKSLLQIENLFEKRVFENAKSLGRARNIFYEKHCELVHGKLERDDIKNDNIQDIVDYVDKIIDCGGYGCLKWILIIINKMIKALTNSTKTNFNMVQFLKKSWNEIEELKTNNQYPLCMKEFVNLITEEALIHNPEFNNIVTVYCNKIIEYGPVKNGPLYYLIERLYSYVALRKADGKMIKEYGHLLILLSEILLYSPVPRKDQRIADNLALEILKNPIYGIAKKDIDLHFNYEIQLLAVSILSTIDDAESLQVITSVIITKIDYMFKSKLRYHGNSQIHRTLQTGLQHLLFILLLQSNVDVKRVSYWCMDLLGRLPHQLSVRICLEWYIALYFHKVKMVLGKKLLLIMQSKNVPLASQIAILFWLAKQKIERNSISNEQFEFVMDTLLSHTMGQMFNIRLLAQYLASKLYKCDDKTKKYEYIIQVIDKTLEENAKDKSFMKLKEGYFFKEFDLIGNQTPYFIHYLLPRLCDVNVNEAVDTDYVLDTMKYINKNLNNCLEDCGIIRKKDEDLALIDVNMREDNKTRDDVESMETIQKKYIPWKSMSDINVYNVEKKRETQSELIVVASLIDKLPNLGGMARTSEVFGVHTYIIDSLRHLHDKQFQGLSVSAERWIDVEEVRPGRPLKEYLNRKKTEGYSVVAAEQTSTSSKLQEFKFPRKTLLLLGHEKEGIPCDLLPMMDHCVEIPQQGFVRSLNVHVTAAIFVWEYTRQNLL